MRFSSEAADGNERRTGTTPPDADCRARRGVIGRARPARFPNGNTTLAPTRSARCSIRLTAVGVLTAVPLFASAATLLRTVGGAERETAVAALAGRPSGVTVTSGNRGGACVYSGRGSYSVDDSGLLTVLAEQDCQGTTNLGTLRVCSLSPDLECAPGGQYAHRYRVNDAGLMVDGALVPWAATPPHAPNLLPALRSRIAAGNDLARAAKPQPVRNTTGLVVRCHSPRSSFMVRSNLGSLMARQQKPDPGGLCAEGVLQQFLAGARLGDRVTAESPMGRCFAASGAVTDWSATRCEVADH